MLKKIGQCELLQPESAGDWSGLERWYLDQRFPFPVDRVVFIPEENTVWVRLVDLRKETIPSGEEVAEDYLALLDESIDAATLPRMARVAGLDCVVSLENQHCFTTFDNLSPRERMELHRDNQSRDHAFVLAAVFASTDLPGVVRRCHTWTRLPDAPANLLHVMGTINLEDEDPLGQVEIGREMPLITRARARSFFASFAFADYLCCIAACAATGKHPDVSAMALRYETQMAEFRDFHAELAGFVQDCHSAVAADCILSPLEQAPLRVMAELLQAKLLDATSNDDLAQFTQWLIDHFDEARS
jgi:hypothetical protein